MANHKGMPASLASDWTKVHADYPVNKSLIWLNNCGTTPIGSPMVKALEHYLEGYAAKGLLWEGKSYAGVKASIYRSLAALLNASPDEFALIHNTAEGMNLLSHGFDLAAGDEIVLLDKEYPSNVYPWEHWTEKGVKIRRVPCEGGPEEFLSDFQATLNSKTRIASLSAVHWCTGMPLPMAQIGNLCAEREVELVVDGSQGVGMVPLDVRSFGIGYMAFSTWKWLLGPLGMGILFISKSKLAKIRPIFKGTESVLSDDQYLPYKTEYKSTTDRFSYSTGSFTDWIHFESSLGYLESIGFPQVRDRIFALAARLSQGLVNMGYSIYSDRFGAVPTGIVSAHYPGLDPAWGVKTLRSKGIVAAERLNRLRFSPHIYLSESQIDQALAELGSLRS